MNKTQIKCLAVFAGFALIGFGPISPGCLIGMYVVAFRPRWFWSVLVNLYANKAIATPTGIAEIQSQQTRRKSFLSLLALFIIDIAPVPVTPVIAFAIILTRPPWFYRLGTTIYQETQIIEASP